MADMGSQMYEGLTRRFVQDGRKELKLAAGNAALSRFHPL
jgi:hypothetical protein